MPPNVAVYTYVARTLTARHDSSPCVDRGQNIIVTYDARGNGDGRVVNTLTGDHQSRITDYTALAVHQNQVGEVRVGEVANTLNTNNNASGRNAPLVHCIQSTTIGRTGDNGADGAGVQRDVSYTLDVREPHAVCFENYRHGEFREGLGPLRASGGIKSGDSGNAVCTAHTVRRLTPVECERLQGFPDFWTAKGADGKTISDSKRYAAIGNSVAIPCVEYIMAGIMAANDNEGR
jgi:site-specific DNA-cytosine methylase